MAALLSHPPNVSPPERRRRPRAAVTARLAPLRLAVGERASGPSCRQARAGDGPRRGGRAACSTHTGPRRGAAALPGPPVSVPSRRRRPCGSLLGHGLGSPTLRTECFGPTVQSAHPAERRFPECGLSQPVRGPGACAAGSLARRTVSRVPRSPLEGAASLSRAGQSTGSPRPGSLRAVLTGAPAPGPDQAGPPGRHRPRRPSACGSRGQGRVPELPAEGAHRAPSPRWPRSGRGGRGRGGKRATASPGRRRALSLTRVGAGRGARAAGRRLLVCLLPGGARAPSHARALSPQRSASARTPAPAAAPPAATRPAAAAT